MTIIPVYDTAAVANLYPCLMKEIENVPVIFTEEFTQESLLNELLARNGNALMWICYDDDTGKIAGFIITKVIPSALGPGRSMLLIYFVISCKNSMITTEEWIKGFELLTDYGKKSGCDSVKFFTRRGGLAKVASLLGFEHDYDIYRRNI